MAGETADEIEVIDPATGRAIGSVARLTAADATRAVDVAQDAFATWGVTLPQERDNGIEIFVGDWYRKFRNRQSVLITR